MTRSLPPLLFVVLLAGGCASSKDGLHAPVLHLDGGTCPTGETTCGGHCVNLATNGAHCGSCGNACPAGQSCAAGKCTPGASGCTGIEMKCNGVCTDTQTDPANCGACNTVCPAGQSCTQGACVAPTCTGTQTDCGGTCVDLTSDVANCGACGTACAANQTCQNSKCTGGTTMMAGCNATLTCLGGCTAGDAMCQMTCLAMATAKARMLLGAMQKCLIGACPNRMGGVCDKAAMGYSATACNQCVQGAATGTCAAQATACANDGGGGPCPAGQTMCGAQCTDVTSDPANCGACGTACPAGQVCNAGQCGAAGTMTGCAATVACIHACAAGDMACQTTCLNNATANGATLLQSLLQCLATNCPNKNGGVCDKTAAGYRKAKCQMCIATAQMAGGKCAAQATACANDVGGGPCPTGQTMCGGACTDVTSDPANCGACGVACAAGDSCVNGTCTAGGGGTTGCSGTVACLNTCVPGDPICQTSCTNAAAAMAITLLNALQMCLDTACAASGGGPCDQAALNYNPVICSQCYANAQKARGPCGAQWTACSNNLP